MLQQLFVEPILQLYEQVRNSLPHLVSMLVFVVMGLVLGWLVRALLSRALRWLQFDHFCRQTGIQAMLQNAAVSKRPSEFMAGIAGGFVVLVSLVLGLNALDFPATNELVSRFFIFLPHLIVSIFLLVLGYLVSRFVERGVLIGSVNAGLKSARLLSKGVYFLMMVFVLAISLEHLGIAQSTIVAAFSIIFGGVVLALSIAFGLGGRELARKFLENRIRGTGTDKDAAGDLHREPRPL
jgi:hypothetical protein